MVSFAITSFVALATTFQAGAAYATSLRIDDAVHISATMTDRKLVAPPPSDDDYGFVLSHIVDDEDWCLTAAYGLLDFKKVGFRKCDFDEEPEEQLWKLEADGKLRSKADETKCMIVNHGDALFDGARMRVANCDLPDTILNKFSLEPQGYLKVQLPFELTPNYCITNRGPSPHYGDTIHAKPCKDRGDYLWTFVNYKIVIEDEDCGEDTNGGCNSSPNIYTPLPFAGSSVDVEIFGEFWASEGIRDTDWYSFTVTEPTLVTASLTTSSSAVLFFVDGLCGAPSVLASTDGSGSPISYLFTTPGDYVVFVATGVFSGVPCDDYTVSVSFEVGDVPEAGVPEAGAVAGDSASLLSAQAPAN